MISMPKNLRQVIISIVVIIWTGVFHYESLRNFYLDPLFKRELPKVKFLFPPAGWIMFFHVDEQFGYAEVYGVKDGVPQPIDPHQIILTRFIGFDNIHRNVLSSVLEPQLQRPFCNFLKKKFPYFDDFLVTAVHYPSVTETPHLRLQKAIYQCQ